MELLAALKDALEASIQREAARSAQCLRATAALAWVCTPITATFRQVCIFASYMWAFVKGKKQGVCPYLPFHD